METKILEYPEEPLDWIPLTEIDNLNTDRKTVIYRFNGVLYKRPCFSSIFGVNPNNIGDVLEICLNPALNRYATRYSNLIKYVEALNELYSGANLSIFSEKSEIVENKYGLWIRIEFTKEYPNPVIRDLCTRIRFLHEDPYHSFIDELLTNPNFKLRDIEEKIATFPDYSIGTEHYLHGNHRDIIQDYSNYEERFLEACKRSYWLNEVLKKLLND